MSSDARPETTSIRRADGSEARPFPRIVRREPAARESLAGALLWGELRDLFPAPPGILPGAETLHERAVGTPLPAAAFTTTSEGARERLARIRAGEGVVVTTGQQPGLFLGPLYTVYKAATAVNLAARLERESGVPVLAVFWVASDDHDWDEVAACRILDRDEELRTLRLAPAAGRAARSVGTAPLPDDVVSLLRAFREEIGGAVAGAPPPWFSELRKAYAPGRTFGAAFVDALAAAFDGLDLAILDSADPGLRAGAAELYAEIVEAPEAVIAAMSAGRARVAERDRAPVLTPPESGLQIFMDDGRVRRHLLRDGDGFHVDGSEGLAQSELLARLAADATAFTPAAALRPVLESRLLPTAATVLGPGEIAYWAQLPPLFEVLGVPMPRVMARDAWALVEPRVDRLLEKLGLDVGTVESEGEGIDDRWIRHSRPPEVREALERLAAKLAKGFDGLDRAVARELPGLKSAAGKARHRAEEALGDLGRTIDARIRQREEVAIAQAARLRRHLLPGGAPQERVVAAAQFLARHGRPLLRDLLAAGRVAGPDGPA
ncbi:MAG: bacillithiol biosynthesis cysteine-adding enzyme BshC [Gemmatimonadota bacterium]